MACYFLSRWCPTWGSITFSDSEMYFSFFTPMCFLFALFLGEESGNAKWSYVWIPFQHTSLSWQNIANWGGTWGFPFGHRQAFLMDSARFCSEPFLPVPCVIQTLQNAGEQLIGDEYAYSIPRLYETLVPKVKVQCTQDKHHIS